jgi:hypothetical protein
MKYKIDSPVIQNNVEHEEILYVIPSSDDKLQSALELLAEYFKKEFRYLNLQYCNLAEEIDHYPYRIVGGGCFRTEEPDNYFLDWVWFHPFARNRGRLKKAWPLFKEKFGEFSVTEPLSAHMKEFIAKHGDVAKSSNQ